MKKFIFKHYDFLCRGSVQSFSLFFLFVDFSMEVFFPMVPVVYKTGINSLFLFLKMATFYRVTIYFGIVRLFRKSWAFRKNLKTFAGNIKGAPSVSLVVFLQRYTDWITFECYSKKVYSNRCCVVFMQVYTS